jgi:2-phosphosulfolactate phosphatase
MKCDLYLTPGEIRDFHTKDKHLILIDVLRACTSLAVALAVGAERIVPADSVEGAKQLLSLLDRKSTLLAGEQDGIKLPGFDLGNSPGEIRLSRLAGMTVVFTSTNAAPLMARMYDEVDKPLLSFVNMRAVVRYVRASSATEWMVLCAGHEGRFSLEDAVCAGMFFDLLEREGEVELDDAARAALLLYRSQASDLEGLIRGCSNGRFLARIGMEADLAEASRLDSVSLVPVVREGRVTAARTSVLG